MILGNEELKVIGEYVQSNLETWLRGASIIPYWPDREIKRMVRVEEGLKNVSGQMQKGFEQVDKRFEMMEKRFEQIDKRFESFESRFNRITAVVTVGFIVLGTLITVFKFVS